MLKSKGSFVVRNEKNEEKRNVSQEEVARGEYKHTLSI